MRPILPTLLLALGLMACGPDLDAVGADDDAIDTDAKADGLWSTSTYYLLRPDQRRCVSPICGGFWVRRVNRTYAHCVDGSWNQACYVADVDYAATGLTDEALAAGGAVAVARGSIVAKDWGSFGKLGHLKVTEAWTAGEGTGTSDTFYRLTDRGIKCARTPCYGIHEAKLNSTLSTDLSDITSAHGGLADDAKAALGGSSILVCGINQPASDGGKQVYIGQYYTQLLPP